MPVCSPPGTLKRMKSRACLERRSADGSSKGKSKGAASYDSYDENYSYEDYSDVDPPTPTRKPNPALLGKPAGPKEKNAKPSAEPEGAKPKGQRREQIEQEGGGDKNKFEKAAAPATVETERAKPLKKRKRFQQKQ